MFSFVGYEYMIKLNIQNKQIATLNDIMIYDDKLVTLLAKVLSNSYSIASITVKSNNV